MEYLSVLSYILHTLNTANYQYLAVAAVEYAKAFGADTYKNMITPKHPVSQEIIKGAKIEDTTFVSEKVVGDAFNEAAIEGARLAGLDIDKLKGTRVSRERMGITREGLQQLIDAMATR